MYERPNFIPKVNVFFYNIFTGGIAVVFLYITELKARGLVSEMDSKSLALTLTKAWGLTLTLVSFLIIDSMIWNPKFS